MTQAYDQTGRLSALSYQGPAHCWWIKALRWIWADQGTEPLLADLQVSSATGLQGFTYANGLKASAQHDQAGRLTRWNDGPMSTLLRFDSSDQLRQIERQAPSKPASTATLAYNPLGQLLELREEAPGATTQHSRFAYDANGNRTQAAFADQLARYEYASSSDRLLGIERRPPEGITLTANPATSPAALPTGAAERTRYHYNAVGEPERIEFTAGAKRQETSLAFDATGQLAQIARNSQPLASYTYNQVGIPEQRDRSFRPIVTDDSGRT